MVKTIQLPDVGNEPFRVFFPEGVFSGIVGVSLWPSYFFKLTQLYPGQAHGRIMAYGLFGAFIFGFLGTAMPRLLSAPPLRVASVLLLLALHFSMVVALRCKRCS